MLTKAFVTEVYSPHSARVRIPLINKIDDVQDSTPRDELPLAAVCTIPNFLTNLQRGDVVIVGFEEDDTAHPIILGYLSTSQGTNSTVDIKCGEIQVTDRVIFPADVTIGKITPENIGTLLNLEDNIKQTFESVKADIVNLQSQVGINSGQIAGLQGDVGDLQSSIIELSSQIQTLSARCDTIEGKFADYLQKNPMILHEGSYGESVSEVTTPVTGQLYLEIKGEVNE